MIRRPFASMYVVSPKLLRCSYTPLHVLAGQHLLSMGWPRQKMWFTRALAHSSTHVVDATAAALYLFLHGLEADVEVLEVGLDGGQMSLSSMLEQEG